MITRSNVAWFEVPLKVGNITLT